MSDALQSAVHAGFVDVRRRALSTPEGTYAVQRLSAGYFVGSLDGTDIALIVETLRDAVPPPPTKLVTLQVRFGMLATLDEGEGSRRIRASIVSCPMVASSSVDLFATVCAAVIRRLGNSPTERQLANEVQGWAALFSRLNERPAQGVTGIAGELAVIRAGRQASAWVKAWHSDPSALLDFSFGGLVTVEVKSTQSADRHHVIGLDQLNDAEHAFVASVLVNFQDHGALIADLVRDIVDDLAEDELRLKVWDVLTRTCGSTLEEVLSRRIDVASTVGSVRFYSSGAIPRPNVVLPLPDEVRSVKFVVNLDRVPPSEVEVP